MTEGRARFAEVFKIVEQGLAGKPFSHHGQFWNIERPIRIRPDPLDKPVNFYGAIGSPGSAEVMGDLGVPPICLSTFPDKLLTRILDRWRARASAPAKDPSPPISVKMFIADSADQARQPGRPYSPPHLDPQLPPSQPH